MADAEFCALVPEAEGCEPKPEPVDGGDMGPRPEGGDDMRKMDDGKHYVEGQIAQINFFFVAVANLVNMYLTVYRYRSDDTYYSAGDVLSTNNWKNANVYGNYFFMGMMGIAAVTQLLAIFGIANGINLLVWMYGLNGLGGLVSIATSIMLFMAYDDAYTVANDSSSSVSDSTNAESVMAGVWNDWVKGVINSILSEGVLMANSEPWYHYNMMKAGLYDEGKSADMVKNGPGAEGDRPPPRDGPQLMAKMVKFIAF